LRHHLRIPCGLPSSPERWLLEVEIAASSPYFEESATIAGCEAQEKGSGTLMARVRILSMSILAFPSSGSTAWDHASCVNSASSAPITSTNRSPRSSSFAQRLRELTKDYQVDFISRRQQVCRRNPASKFSLMVSVFLGRISTSVESNGCRLTMRPADP
jgi:hypothetical protein